MLCKLMCRKEQTENPVTLRKVVGSKVRKPELLGTWGEMVSRTEPIGGAHQGDPGLSHGSLAQATPLSRGYSTSLLTPSFLEAEVSP